MGEPLATYPALDAAVANRRLYDFLRWLLKRLDLSGTRDVLDYGCGSGQLTRLLADHVSPQAHTIGIDFSPRSIREARAATDPGRYPHVEYRTIRRDDPRLIEGAFDLALCVRPLMHRQNAESFLAQLTRVVRPGGRVIAVETNLSDYFSTELQALPAQLLSYLHPYIARLLAMLMTEAGLEPTDLIPDFVVSREPGNGNPPGYPNGQFKTLRPCLHHVGRFNFEDYVWKLQNEVALQTHNAHTLLFQVAVVGQKPLA